MSGSFLVMWLLCSVSLPAVADELAAQFKRATRAGITFLFALGMDDGIYLEFRGDVARFRYLDGEKADGSLQKHVDTGRFTLAGRRVRVRGAFLRRDLILFLEPVPPGVDFRFFLRGKNLPMGGFGPVSPVAPRPAAP